MNKYYNYFILVPIYLHQFINKKIIFVEDFIFFKYGNNVNKYLDMVEMIMLIK